jgi:hypothetical protein
MPRTSLVDPQKAKAAVSILIRAPGVTIQEAMILAKFTEEEAGRKLMQRKVSRNAQKRAAEKGKAVATISAAESSPPIEQIDFNEQDDQSPNNVGWIQGLGVAGNNS